MAQLALNFWTKLSKIFRKEKTQKALSFEAKQNRSWDWQLFFLRVSRKERLEFVDQLSTLLGSGITILEALTIIAGQTRHKGLKHLYELVIKDINAGKSLAESLSSFPKIFPSIYAALVESGEKSGALPEVLEELNSQLEEQNELISKIKGAMIYPVVIILLSLVLVVGLLTFVVPKISAMYHEAHVELPAITQALIDLSNFIQESWQILFLSIAGGLFFLYLLVKKVNFIRKIWEHLIFASPVFGQLAKKKSLVMFFGNLGFLLKHGVLISEALPVSKKTLDSVLYQEEVERIYSGVIQGQAMSELLMKTNKKGKQIEHDLFPYEAAQLVKIGEKTGLVHSILLKIKHNYLKALNNTVKNLSSLLEPFLIVFIGALVGTLLLAIMMPFFYIGNTIG